MEIIQENTKMMNRYCFSLNNIEIKPYLLILLKLILLTWVLAIFYSFAALVHKIFFQPLEDKIHIFAPPCNILYL